MSYQFALDIGTRSIVGVVIEREEDKIQVIDLCPIEHTKRSMVDGQIHDVKAVAKTIIKVKQILEEKYGPVEKVSIAAAGRALQTVHATAKYVHAPNQPIQKEDIKQLEYTALSEAQKQLALQFQDQKISNYHLVGYSTVATYLDGEKMGQLEGHKGTELGIEIIATFLPHIVVDSLYTALYEANLEIEALTLEPIAAIHALIPESMRRLNIILVDIGAGTSDLAVTKNGSIVAYGMVPFAGDEITEALSDAYLLDFHDAEKLKRKLQNEEEVKITDVLGFETVLKSKDIIETIRPTISNLAFQLKEEIHKLNEGIPAAIMLIGGGSLTPELGDELAKHLDLPSQKIAIRDVTAIRNIKLAKRMRTGPENITPIGIALYAKENQIRYNRITINGQHHQIYETGTQTVSDAFINAGIRAKDLYGKMGLSKVIHINGVQKVIPGIQGSLPVITKNGQPCTLQDLVAANDVFEIQKGTDGRETEITLAELLPPMPTCKIYAEGKPIENPCRIQVNEKVVDLNTWIHDRDHISFSPIINVQDIITLLKDKEIFAFTIYIDDEPYICQNFQYRIFINEKEVNPSTLIQNGDIIECTKEPFRIENLIEEKKWLPNMPIKLTFNHRPLIIDIPLFHLYEKEKLLTPSDLCVNHMRITKVINQKPLIFQDILKYVDVKKPENQTVSSFKLLKNGKDCTFTDIIQDGDEIELTWIAT